MGTKRRVTKAHRGWPGNVSLMLTAILPPYPLNTFKTGFTFYLATCGTDDPAFDMSGLTWRDLLIGGPE
jgi:hypothetical protein